MDRVIERGCCPTELAADGRLRYPSVLVVRHDAQHLAVTVLLDLVVKIISVVAIADLFHGTERSERRVGQGAGGAVEEIVIDRAALRARLADIHVRIARAADRAQRDPASIRLVAVSKTFSPDHVRAAAEAGQVDFGENKVQEAIAKIDATGDLSLRWHLVGHLQSNKAKKAGARFDVVHSIADVELIAKLDEAAATAARRIDLLVQVDLAGEATKHGAREPELLAIFEAVQSARSVRMVGLMLLPPAFDDPEGSRPFFRELRAVRDRLRDRGVPADALTELSMGMSHDFEVAIEEGATLIRIGTAIFGERPPVRLKPDTTDTERASG